MTSKPILGCFSNAIGFAVALVLATATAGFAATQRLALQAGWNLVSMTVEPEDSTVRDVLKPLIDADNFEALWAYDAASATWASFPPSAAGRPSVERMESGRGYWLKVKGGASIEIEGDFQAASGPGDLATEWNLVGFALEEPTPYERIITNAAIRQIWTFDAAQGFLGVVLDPQGTVLREDFIDLEAGRGYWLYSNSEVSLAPVLGTGLPPDLDVPPLVSAPAVTQSLDDDLAPKPFTRSPGDIDIADDGFYDRTSSQRAIDFGERQTIQPISIFNDRSGVLSWTIEVVDPDATPWLRLRDLDRASMMQTRVVEKRGTVASETDVVDIIVDRVGLPPGEFRGALRITTNAEDLPPPAEAIRVIQARMSVAELDGDYRLTAHIESVNDRPADLPDPRLTISLYRDGDGLKAVVNEAQTLLISQRLRMRGAFYETGTSRFQVSGSYEMPADDPGNPYGVAVRRDLTLRGQRRDPLDPADDTLGPLDLKGEYFETLRNVTAEPIYLAGSFVAERLGPEASARDLAEADNRSAGNIPDSGRLVRTIEIDRRLLITELDVTVELQHPRPEDLVVTLIAPDGTEAVLRNRSAAVVGRVMYDEIATPVDSLEVFNGRLSAGVYTLLAEDVEAGETGSLINWDLSIRGSEVRDLAGTLDGVPEGTDLVLTGCGVTELATTGAGGSFSFSNLVDCVYRITVLESGFQTVGQDVVVAGADVTDLSIAVPAADPFMSSPVELPSAANAAFVILTTSGGAGTLAPVRANESIFDATTYDVDRPPVGTFPQAPDTNAFLGVVDSLTRSNVVGINGQVDGPVGPSSRRLTVTIGQPVIGTSVQGDLRLTVGANP